MAPIGGQPPPQPQQQAQQQHAPPTLTPSLAAQGSMPASSPDGSEPSGPSASPGPSPSPSPGTPGAGTPGPPNPSPSPEFEDTTMDPEVRELNRKRKEAALKLDGLGKEFARNVDLAKKQKNPTLKKRFEQKRDEIKKDMDTAQAELDALERDISARHAAAP